MGVVVSILRGDEGSYPGSSEYGAPRVAVPEADHECTDTLAQGRVHVWADSPGQMGQWFTLRNDMQVIYVEFLFDDRQIEDAMAGTGDSRLVVVDGDGRLGGVRANW